MLKEEIGKYFRDESAVNFDTRGAIDDESACILIIDPVLGSRLSLAQAVAQPSYVVQTASTISEAISYLDEGNVSLVIAERRLEECDGIEFLADLRSRYPDTCRALVIEGEAAGLMRRAIDRAGLSFLLNKPWSPKSLRETVRNVLGGNVEFAGWSRGFSAHSLDRHDFERTNDPLEPGRQHEILLRGLLAGLNSCEFAAEVFELLHTELAAPFCVSHWLWVDEERATGTRIAGDWPVEENISVEALSADDSRLLSKARRSLRVTRLNDAPVRSRPDTVRTICLSLAIREDAKRSMTCLIWAHESRTASLVVMLSELQMGLQMTFRRIRMAEARAIAAHSLAKRVSEELRTPVGALTHAIDRLRGEVERAGMSTEWVDRVSSESERVVRVVEHLESEMWTDAVGMSSPAN